MPRQEIGRQVDDLGQVGVHNCIIKVSVDGSRVECLVQLGWLVHDAFDGIGVGLALFRSHGVEVLADLDVVIRTRLVLPRKAVVVPVVDVGKMGRRAPWLGSSTDDRKGGRECQKSKR